MILFALIFVKTSLHILPTGSSTTTIWPHLGRDPFRIFLSYKLQMHGHVTVHVQTKLINHKIENV
jgi:hypothetical protein